MSETRRLHRRVPATAVVGLMVVLLPWMGASAAHAEACATSGLQPRVLVTDDPGFIETQYCLDGVWTASSRMQVVPDTKVIKEHVWDPRDDRYKLSRAEAFFGLTTKDPYESVTDAKGLYDAATKPKELLELRIALADVRAQALLNRQGTHRTDGCRTRSNLYSSLDARYSSWRGPASIGPVGEPSRIDFDFAPGTSRDTRAVVLNAIDQYAAAVAGQDYEGRYPSAIVPHDSATGRPATITFRDERLNELEEGVMAETRVQYKYPIPTGSPNQWEHGEITMTANVNPAAIGHEIAHVLGIDHLSVAVEGATMNPTGRSSAWWSPSTPIGVGVQRAFDECMFLPPVQPLVVP